MVSSHNTCLFLFHDKSNEVGGSHNMEKEGLKRSLELLESKGVAVDYIVTDRHPQIQKFLRDRNLKHMTSGTLQRVILVFGFDSRYNYAG